MKNISRDDLQERAGMWDIALFSFLLFLLFGGLSSLPGNSENFILIARFGGVGFLTLAVVVAIVCWRSKRALQRMNHDI